jgi:response regulator RpfG family c-di-GMP phosphodiesterase
MNGAVLLSSARRDFPDVVRILLTGYAELDAAVSAVNDGNIFRFLLKPCPPDTLGTAVADALRQHQLIVGERELLERTLKGSVDALVDVLSLAAPAAFGRTGFVRACVAHMAKRLEVAERWDLELAAVLSPIGCIALPASIVEQIFAGADLSAEDRALFESHPKTGLRLLATIPRLDNVARMVGHQLDAELPSDLDERAALGARMLRVADGVDAAVRTGKEISTALKTLRRELPRDHLPLLRAMSDFKWKGEEGQSRSIRLAELTVGMVLEEDVRSRDGNVIVGKGREVTLALVDRLRAFGKSVGVIEPFRVTAPAPQ